MKYRKKPVVIEAITFEEFVQYGRDNGANIVNGMPWSFSYNGHAISHENDQCYLINTLEGTLYFTPLDMLITGVKGEIYPCKLDIFEATYELEADMQIGTLSSKQNANEVAHDIRLNEMATLIKRLCVSIRKFAPTNNVATLAMDWLARNGFEGFSVRESIQQEEKLNCREVLADGVCHHCASGKYESCELPMRVLQEPISIPWNGAVQNILARPNFACCGIAQKLREIGHDIPEKSEAEQAAVIYWMLNLYLLHGDEWSTVGEALLSMKPTGK